MGSPESGPFRVVFVALFFVGVGLLVDLEFLAQIGEFSFVLAAVGYQASIISEFSHKATIVVIALTLLLSPAWIGVFRRLRRSSQR